MIRQPIGRRWQLGLGIASVAVLLLAAVVLGTLEPPGELQQMENLLWREVQ